MIGILCELLSVVALYLTRLVPSLSPAHYLMSFPPAQCAFALCLTSSLMCHLDLSVKTTFICFLQASFEKVENYLAVDVKNNSIETFLKDTYRENTPSNKTQALTKGMNTDIWVIVTLNQLFKRGSYTQFFFSKKKKKYLVAKLLSL